MSPVALEVNYDVYQLTCYCNPRNAVVNDAVFSRSSFRREV